MAYHYTFVLVSLIDSQVFMDSPIIIIMDSPTIIFLWFCGICF